MNVDIHKRMGDPTVVAWCCDGDAWPRSRLADTPIPDAWMGLVEQRDGRRRFVPAGEDPRCGRDDKLLLVRNRLITVPVNVVDCPAACGNLVSGLCELLVKWEAKEHELAALRQRLMDQPELTLSRLADAVADAGGRAAVQEFVRTQPGEKLLREDVRDALLATFRQRLKRFLFEAGLVLDHVAQLSLTSATFEHQETLRRQAARQAEHIKARDRVEQAALAATKRRLADLSDVFEKLKTAVNSSAEMKWRDLLPALSPGERGRLLENLWRITPDRNVARAIVAVAGDECVWLDPAEPEHISRRAALGEELGGLRSVAHCPRRDRLFVGAARGVWGLDAHSGEIVGRYEVPDAGMARKGFNAVATSGDRLYATHSELGCWSWPLEGAGDLRPLLQPGPDGPRTIRAVTTTDDGRVLFAADDCVHVYSASGSFLAQMETGAGAIHGLAVLENLLFVGTSKGMLLQDTLDGTGGVWLVLHRAAGPIESLQARRWDDLVEVVFPGGARGSYGVYSVYGDEGFVARLLETGTPVRRAWACDDLILALNELRDRLIVFNANLADRPRREVLLARTLGHSIQDACIVTSDEATKRRSDEGEQSHKGTEAHRQEGESA